VISFNIQNNIAIIDINFPPYNAVSIEFLRSFHSSLDKAINSSCRAIIITGTGPNFCSGMNLKEVPFYTREQQAELIQLANSFVYKLFSYPKPTIAAVNGNAIGAGFMLALACDYRIASDSPNSQFSLNEARAGIPFPACPAVLLQHALAPQDVRLLTLYAKSIDAERALQISVFDQLVNTEELVNKAKEIALDMATAPSDSYAKVKQQFRLEAINKMRDIVDNNSDPMLSGWLSQQGKSAADAALGKREQ